MRACFRGRWPLFPSGPGSAITVGVPLPEVRQGQPAHPVRGPDPRHPHLLRPAPGVGNARRVLPRVRGDRLPEGPRDQDLRLRAEVRDADPGPDSGSRRSAGQGERTDGGVRPPSQLPQGGPRPEDPREARRPPGPRAHLLRPRIPHGIPPLARQEEGDQLPPVPGRGSACTTISTSWTRCSASAICGSRRGRRFAWSS